MTTFTRIAQNETATEFAANAFDKLIIALTGVLAMVALFAVA